MSKWVRKLTGALLLTCMIFFSFGAKTSAATTVDWSQKGSITITPKSSAAGHAVVKGTVFKIYRVATVSESNNNLTYTLTSNFKASKADLSVPDSEDLAAELAEYVEKKELTGKTGKADSTGKVTFSDLELGLYLVVQKNDIAQYYAVTPFMVSIPMTNTKGTSWVYNVKASPKADVNPSGMNFGDNPDNPEAPNSPGGDSTGTNPTNPGSPLNPSGSSDKLLQTGQLNWPVPVLAVAGVILFSLGWALTYLRKRDDETPETVSAVSTGA